MLLSTDTLAGSLKTKPWQILDVSQPSVYQQCHIPGAIHVPYERLVTTVGKANGMMPPIEELIAFWQSIGLDPKKPVVVYDDVQGTAAARLFWTLQCFKGVDVHYLDGGILGWMRAKAPCSEVMPTLAPNQATWTYTDDVLATSDYLLSHLDDPQVAIWDARSEAEYVGLKVMADRGGHIPGAIHYEFKNAMDEDNACQLRPLEDIASELSERGLTKDKTVVTYCQTHCRSAFAYMLLKLMGYPHAKGYAGSWSEWGNLSHVPIEEATA